MRKSLNLFFKSTTLFDWGFALQPSLKYSQLLPSSLSYLLTPFPLLFCLFQATNSTLSLLKAQSPPETGRQSGIMTLKSKNKCLVQFRVNSSPLSITYPICRLFSSRQKEKMYPYGTIWFLHVTQEVPDLSPTTVATLTQRGNVMSVILVGA